MTENEPVSDDTRALAEQVIALLRDAGQTVAAAESLTGGLVVAGLTTVPGASNAVRGGVVAYATELKAILLGVPRAMLAAHGAVYPAWRRPWQTACASGCGATFGVATTGVAGPDPQDGQPVGTVHIAVSADNDTVVRTLALDGDRDRIRRVTVERLLALLIGRLREDIR